MSDFGIVLAIGLVLVGLVIVDLNFKLISRK
jgi:hypothetical protein